MPIGLLAETNGSPDYKSVKAVTLIVENWWNDYQSPHYGFTISTSPEKIQLCCDRASKLFQLGGFPEKPGPFKRVAALLVLGRLLNLFEFNAGVKSTRQSSSEARVGYNFTSRNEKRAWSARMVVLCIPVVFAGMKIKIDGKNQWMDEWDRFPSPHYKLDFMAWLRWLDDFENLENYFKSSPELWERITNDRLFRMILSTSLMVESCYYLSPTVDSPASRLLKLNYSGAKDLDEELRLDLYYDHRGPVS